LSNSYAAIKVGKNPTGDKLLEREFTIMRAIGTHTNIVNCIEFGNRMDRIHLETGQGMTSNYLALEFASNKNLIEYMMHHP
jgi:hypothetical protein